MMPRGRVAAPRALYLTFAASLLVAAMLLAILLRPGSSLPSTHRPTFELESVLGGTAAGP